jgi:hypothetical protein
MVPRIQLSVLALQMYPKPEVQVSCDGAVESWLQNVVDGMRAALSKEFCESVVAYNEARVYTLL